MPIYRGMSPARLYVGDSMPRALYRGNVEVWRRDSVWQRVTSSVSVPPWAAYVDVIALGGGGGGANGRVIAGTGGGAGQWGGGTYPTPPGSTLSVAIGAGGAGGVAAAFGNTPGAPGGATAVTIAGPNGSSVVRGNGGAGGEGSPGRLGQSPGPSPYFDSPREANGTPIAGGGEAGTDQPGKPPGGGGGAGRGTWSPINGQRGADGAAWVRFRSY